jgi:hypothetical protein
MCAFFAPNIPDTTHAGFIQEDGGGVVSGQNCRRSALAVPRADHIQSCTVRSMFIQSCTVRSMFSLLRLLRCLVAVLYAHVRLSGYLTSAAFWRDCRCGHLCGVG